MASAAMTLYFFVVLVCWMIGMIALHSSINVTTPVDSIRPYTSILLQRLTNDNRITNVTSMNSSDQYYVDTYSEESLKEMETEQSYSSHHLNYTWVVQHFKQGTMLPEKYRLSINTGNDTGSYFLYQPSGGWGNQRLILRWAIMVANCLNRTLVLPPVAPHSDLYKGFNKFGSQSIVHMGQVLNLDILGSRLSAGLKVHIGDMNSYRNVLPHLPRKNFDRPEYLIYTEPMLRKFFKNEESPILFWKKSSMWKCCYTDDNEYYRFLNRGIVFNKYLVDFAKSAVEEVLKSQFNSIHFRRGDSAYHERKSIESYVTVHPLLRFKKQLPLYIATDQQDHSIFDPLVKRYNFKKLVFTNDVFNKFYQPMHEVIPLAMHGSFLGFLDQIVCALSLKWTGSRHSTFSYAIAALRGSKEFTLQIPLKYHFLPRNARNTESNRRA